MYHLGTRAQAQRFKKIRFEHARVSLRHACPSTALEENLGGHMHVSLAHACPTTPLEESQRRAKASITWARVPKHNARRK